MTKIKKYFLEKILKIKIIKKNPIFIERNIKDDPLTLTVIEKNTGKNKMISIKIYKRGNDLLIGACDEKLLGKKFEDGKFQIDVKREFYGGERIDPKALKKFLIDATIANLVGEETVRCAIEMGLVDPDCIIKIKGVPHAQMVRMLT